MLLPWLRQLVTRPAPKVARPGSRWRPYRPRLERLEDRLAPVTNITFDAAVTHALTINVAGANETATLSVTGTSLSVSSGQGTTSDGSLGFLAGTAADTANVGSIAAANDVRQIIVTGAAGTQSVVIQGGIFTALTVNDGAIENVTFNTAASSFAKVSPGAANADLAVSAADVLTLNQNLTTQGGGSINLAATNGTTLTADVALDTTDAGATPAGGAITLGAVTGGGHSLALNAGTGGVITVTGAVDNVSTLTVTNSGGATFQGDVGAGTAGAVTLSDTAGIVAFQGSTTSITTLTTANKGYNLSLASTTTTVSNAATFLNTGAVTLGGAAADGVTFSGGLTVNGAAVTASLGTVSTADLTVATGSFGGTAGTVNSGNVTISGGTLAAPAGPFNVSGNWSKAGGTFTPGAGTVAFTRGSGTQTLDGGGAAFNNVNHSGAGALQLTGNGLTVGGTLANAGALDLNGQGLGVTGAVTNTGTVKLKGTEAVTLTAGNDTAEGTWLYYGDNTAGPLTLNDFGATDYFNLTIDDQNATKATFRAGAALAVAGALAATSGTYDANGNTTNVSGATTVNGGTYAASSATQTLGGGLSVSSGAFTGSAGAVSTTAVSLTGGTLTAPSTTLSVSGNFSHSLGTFSANGGTVVLDGAGQSLGGATTFNNLSKVVAAADMLTFAAGAANKTTVAGTLTLRGASGNLLALRSATPGAQWQIDPQGTRDVSFVDVKDSDNVNMTAVSASSSVDSGNNTNWAILTAAGALTYGSPGGNLALRKNGTDLEIRDASNNLVAALPLAGVNSVTVNGADGAANDLTVDGTLVLSGTITFNGGTGAGSHNSLTVSGGTFTNEKVAFTPSDPGGNNGSVSLDSHVISFNHLHPLLLNVGSAANVEFDLPNTTTNVSFEASGVPATPLQLRSTDLIPTFETTEFTDPTSSLTIKSFAGTTNSFTVSSVSPPAAFDAAFIYQGGGGTTDTVNVNGALSLGHAGGNTGSVSIVANTINVNGAVDTTAGTAGNVTLTAAGPVTLAADVKTGGSLVDVNAAGVAQSAGAVTAGSLRLQGAGTFTLNQAGNDVTTLAANVTGDLTYRQGANPLSVGNVLDPVTLIATAGINTNGHVLTLTNGGNLNLNADITAGGGFTQNGAGAVVTSGTRSVTTSGGPVSFASALTLGGSLSIDATTGGSAAGSSITFSGAVNGTTGGPAQTLTLNAGTGGTLNAAGLFGAGGVADATGLTTVTVTRAGVTSFNGAVAITGALAQANAATGATTFAAAVSVGSAALRGTAFTIDSTFTAAAGGAVAVTNSGAFTTLAGAAITAPGGFSTTGNAILGDNVTTTNTPLSIGGALTIADGRSVTLSTQAVAGAGDITITGATGGTAGGAAEALTLNAGTGAVNVAAVSGAGGLAVATGLTAMTLTSAGVTNFNGAVAITGALTQTNAVTGATTFAGTVAVGSATLRGTAFTIDSTFTAAAGGAVAVTNSGAFTTLAGAAVTAPGGFSASGNAVLADNVTTTNTAITIGGALTIAEGRSVTLSTQGAPGAGDISISGATNGTASGAAEALTLNAGTGTVNVAAVSGAGGAADATGLTAMTLTSAGVTNFNGAVAITGALAQTNAATGATTFAGTVTVGSATLRGTAFTIDSTFTATAGGAVAVTNSGAFATLAGAAVTAPGGFSTTGDAVLADNVTTTNTAITIGGALTIAEGRSVTLSTQGAPGAGDITITGATGGTAGGAAEALTLNAGTGTVGVAGVFGAGGAAVATGLTTLTLTSAGVTSFNGAVAITGALAQVSAATGATTFAAAVSVGSATLRGTAFTIDSTFTAAAGGAVAVTNSGAFTTLAGAAVTAPGGFSASGNAVLADNVTTTNTAITIGGALTIAEGRSVTLSTQGAPGAGDISVAGATGGTAGGAAEALTLNAGTGAVNVAAVSGAGGLAVATGLAAVTVTSAGVTNFNGAVAITGALAQTNAATGATTFAGTVSVGSATLRGTAFHIDNAFTAAVAVAVTNSGAFATLAGAAVTAPGGFSTTGDAVLGDNVTTTNTAITIGGALTIADGRSVTLSTQAVAGAGDITITGATGGTAGGAAEALTLNAGTGAVNLAGVFGAGGLAVATGLTAMTLTSAGVTNFNGAVAITGALTQTNAVTGATTFAGTVAVGSATLRGTTFEFDKAFTAAAGAVAVTNSGALTTLAGAAITAPGGFSTTGSAVLGDNVTTTNTPLSIGGTAALTGPVTASAGSGSITFNSTVALGANTLTVNGSGSATILGTISGVGGALTERGSGTLTLPAGVTSTYTGPTTIIGGTLLVNGTLSNSGVVLAGPSAAAATLAGSGSVNGITATGSGTVAPGPLSRPAPLTIFTYTPLASGGILSSNANVVLTSSVKFVARLNGKGTAGGGAPTAGADYDQLSVTGTFSAGGATLAPVLGTASNVNDVFAIMKTTGGEDTTTFAASSFTLRNQKFPVVYKVNSAAVVPPTTFPAGNDVVMYHQNTAPDITFLGVTRGPSPITDSFVVNKLATLNTPATPTIVQRDTAVFKWTFTDPDELDAHTVNINYGDGSSAVVPFTGPVPVFPTGSPLATFTVQPNHNYPEPINATVIASVGDGHVTPTNTRLLKVLDAPLVNGIAIQVPGLNGTALGLSRIATFQDEAPSNTGTYGVSVKWGDGTTTDNATSPGDFVITRIKDKSVYTYTVYAKHNFTGPGRFNPIITITSDGLSSVFSNRPPRSRFAQADGTQLVSVVYAGKSKEQLAIARLFQAVSQSVITADKLAFFHRAGLDEDQFKRAVERAAVEYILFGQTPLQTNGPSPLQVTVDSLYIRFLGSVTPQQRSAGMQFLAHGGTRQQLAAIILGSEDYFNKHQRNLTSWLKAIATDYFAPCGVTPPWGATPPTLPAGVNRAALANAIVRSDAGNRCEIQYMFKTYLGSPATPNQLQPWLQRLQQTSLNQVSREFLQANLGVLEGSQDPRGLTPPIPRSKFPAV